MNLTVSIGPIVSLIAGILILIMPRLLNYIVAIYLIVMGLLGLFASGHRTTAAGYFSLSAPEASNRSVADPSLIRRLTPQLGGKQPFVVQQAPHEERQDQRPFQRNPM